jgi:polyisoprenoid-binding protein YceI
MSKIQIRISKKKNIYPITALLVIAASAFVVIQTQNWKIGDDYSIKFSGNNVSGIFKGLKGTVSFDDANLAESKFDVSIDVATINTGNGMKNTVGVFASGFEINRLDFNMKTPEPDLGAATILKVDLNIPVHKQ